MRALTVARCWPIFITMGGRHPVLADSFRKFVVRPLVPAGIRTLPGPDASSPFAPSKIGFAPSKIGFAPSKQPLCFQ